MSILVIPDIHQDVDFLRQVFAMHPAENFATIIFLGDFFWAKQASLREPELFVSYCDFLDDLSHTLSPKLVLLCGNRDIPYLLFAKMKNAQSSISLPDYMKNFFDPVGASVARERISPQFWNSLKCAHLQNNWLFSHAGVSLQFLPSSETLQTSIDLLNQRFDKEILEAQKGNFLPLLQASKGKKGPLKVGGPLWQIFDQEFVDDLPHPQVVGHTRGKDLRSSGRSFCIDCEQTAVAIIDSNGLFSFHRLNS